jgi:hypothetical protein
VTVTVTLSAVEGSIPSLTTRSKVSTRSAAPTARLGAVKLGLALVSPVRVTAVPLVWVQAKLRVCPASFASELLPSSVTVAAAATS